MKKKLLISGLLAVALFVLNAAPILADTLPAAQMTDEQIKLAQINYNATLDILKSNQPELATALALPITTINPDSVIGKAAIIHHYAPAYTPPVVYYPYYPYYGCCMPFVSNPYIFYPNYYYTYQYR
ncbi:MAG: hypothetical protein K6F73_09700 [Lachnospiraceae bacterium]|nr:hypothetical protein [Lachnospiraceae bacterium]